MGLNLQLESLSGPIVFGGLGKLRMTSLASWDLLTITSFNRTAVCMRRTLEDSLLQNKSIIRIEKDKQEEKSLSKLERIIKNTKIPRKSQEVC